MKLSYMLLAAVLSLLSFGLGDGSPTSAQAVAHELWIVEVSAADAEAAERLGELLGQGTRRVQAASAREPGTFLSTLLSSTSERAVVLDREARRVHVLERDGSVRTRIIEGVPTAYLTAFVASELLALERVAVVAPTPAPPAQPEPSAVARVEGHVSIDFARPYADAWLVRPSFGLSMWLAQARSPYTLPLLGLELAGPARLQRTSDDGRVDVTRWETGPVLGIAIPTGRLRVLLFGSGRLAITRASFSGALGTERRTLGLGLGGGAALECGLTRWLAVRASVDAHAMLRRGAYAVQGERLLREQFGLISLSLGVVVHTP